MRSFFLSLILLIFVISAPNSLAAAQAVIRVEDNQASLQFPISINFNARFDSSSKITSAVLEYGVEQLTCGTVIAKALPRFSPQNNVTLSWTWEMRQSGSLPPGARIWWRWRVGDEAGNQVVTETQSLTWLDNEHNWQTLSGGNINLHWYSGGQAFGKELHNASVNALERLGAETGLKAEKPVDLYIYANANDMRDAVLYEPSWTGGIAFPDHDIVIIGISPDNLEWGKSTAAHELVHVLVGHLTFSCLGDVPTWLSEGLAVWGEGGLDQASNRRLDEAIRNNTLFPLRSLSGGFSEVADKASLSYSQSYSVVKYLIDGHGKEKMTAVLIALRDGKTIDEALQEIYSFNIEGLEDAWRKAIGAQARAAAANPTPTVQPTPVPTIRPVSGFPAAGQPDPTSLPALITPTPGADSLPPLAVPESGMRLPLSILVIVGCAGAGILAVIGIAVFLTIRSANARKEN